MTIYPTKCAFYHETISFEVEIFLGKKYSIFFERYHTWFVDYIYSHLCPIHSLLYFDSLLITDQSLSVISAPPLAMSLDYRLFSAILNLSLFMLSTLSQQQILLGIFLSFIDTRHFRPESLKRLAPEINQINKLVINCLRLVHQITEA